MRGNRSMTHLKHREIWLDLYYKCNSIYSILLFSCSVMSNYLRPHGLQHTRLLCPSQSPGAAQTQVRWVGDAIQPPRPLSSPSLLPSTFPASGSFPMSWLFTSADQGIGASASASVLPMHFQDWFPLGWTGRISLQSKGLSRVFSSISLKAVTLRDTQPSLWSTSHIHTWLLEKE